MPVFEKRSNVSAVRAICIWDSVSVSILFSRLNKATSREGKIRVRETTFQRRIRKQRIFSDMRFCDRNDLAPCEIGSTKPKRDGS
jgi:hypothetical protein